MLAARLYPALDLSWPVHPVDDAIDRVMAEIDDCHPTAIEEHATGVRAFFASADDRDDAARRLMSACPEVAVSPLLVPDDQWAERSQAALTPVRVGRLIIRPPWAVAEHGAADASAITITIQPSMGFGTGHHQSTRLCLRCLQMVPLAGKSVIDIGTGSGVLAIAASKLGASRVAAVDVDPDALTSARENLDLNHATHAVELHLMDVAEHVKAPIAGGADVIAANLTGSLIERLAPLIARWLKPQGTLVASGFQVAEEEAVAGALRRAGLALVGHLAEDDWLAVTASPTRSIAR
jgi:ribosomal protein L11 methyltransferase